MRKKLFCFLLAVVMIGGILPMAALADGSTTFAVGTASGLPGAAVDLPVTISGSAFAAFTIEISYPGVLTLNGIAFGDAQLVDTVEGQDMSGISTGLYAINGNRITYVNGANVPGGTLTLKFTISGDSTAGDYDVSVTVTEIRDINEQSLASATTSGKVTVTAFMLGDMNGDKRITLVDLMQLLKAYKLGEYRAEGDMDGNGRITLPDLMQLLKLYKAQ